MAYLDVLGLSAALADPAQSRRYAEAIDAIISPIIRQKEEPWLVLPHVRTGEEIEIDLSLPVAKRSRVTTISDAILVSVPLGIRCSGSDRLRRVFDCLRAVYGIQQSLLALGLRTRGGISIGGLIHKNHFVVGDGLTRAYELESQVAIYPRAVIDDEIIKILVEGEMPDMVLFRNRVAHLVREDADGTYFVDFLAIDPVIPGVRMGWHIDRIYEEIRSDLAEKPPLRIKQKLRWMLRYLTTTNAALKEKGLQRCSHASPYFSLRYFRDDQNLLTYVAALEAQRKSVSTT